jgi:hypothetical protein
MRDDSQRLGIRLTPEERARRIAEQTTALVGRATDDEIRALGELAELATGASVDTRDALLAFCLLADVQTSTAATAMAGGLFTGLETLNDADLERDLAELAERMGIKLPRLFRGAKNGIGAKTAFDYQDELPGIICGGRMLALARDQVRAVLCHEFSHVDRRRATASRSTCGSSRAARSSRARVDHGLGAGGGYQRIALRVRLDVGGSARGDRSNGAVVGQRRNGHGRTRATTRRDSAPHRQRALIPQSPSGTVITLVALEQLLRIPSESLIVDFQERLDWDQGGRHQSETLKSLVCMANRRGGTVVIGVRDLGGNRFDRVGLATDDAMPDVTKLNQVIRSHFDPPVACEVAVMTLEGLPYGIIAVPQFQDTPHICTRTAGEDPKTKKPVIQQGDLYVRSDAMNCERAGPTEVRTILEHATAVRLQSTLDILRGTGQTSGSASGIPILELDRPVGQNQPTGLVVLVHVRNVTNEPALAVRISLRGESLERTPERESHARSAQIPSIAPSAETWVAIGAQDYLNVPVNQQPSPPRVLFSRDWFLVAAEFVSRTGAKVIEQYEWAANASQNLAGTWTLHGVEVRPDPVGKPDVVLHLPLADVLTH